MPDVIVVLRGPLGVPADPTAVQTVQVTIDTLVGAEVMPFWRAVLGYEYRGDSPDEDLIDPHGRGPSLWFQRMDAPRRQRNRIHIDIWVPHDQAETRVVAAAIAAGGRLVTDEYAPSWWVLADAGGNDGERPSTSPGSSLRASVAPCSAWCRAGWGAATATPGSVAWSGRPPPAARRSGRPGRGAGAAGR
jgi:hypothetical protein